MPYIKQEQRDELKYRTPINCGELNYEITQLIKEYIIRKGECYQTYNDIIGALEGAKLELYRRKTAPYEFDKIVENGDVY